MTPEELRARAIRMQAFLDDDDIKAAFAGVETELTEEWRRCFDERERDNLWRALQIIDRLKTWMRSAASYDRTQIRRVK